MSGRTIGVLGLARSGGAAARLALARGEHVYVSDAGDTSELRAAAETLRGFGAAVELGSHSTRRLATCDLIVISPGISPTAPVLLDEGVRAVPRVSELEYAFTELDAPVLAVTGTNGKSTTTALAAHLLEGAGMDAPAAGNIGLPLSDIALRERQPDWVVVEASSFQLADTDCFAPRIGVLTNLAPDHLDRYASVDAYYADKARLFTNATPECQWVLNGEDEAARALPADADGDRLYFRVTSPLAAGERGGFISDADELVLRMNGHDTRLTGVSELRLLGEHNRANALAAAIAAVAAGASVTAVAAGLRTFSGLEHRLEIVAERNGVLWLNDSKATNIASTRVALRSLTRPTVLLLGGRHKGEPYTALLADLVRHVRLVIAYGEAASSIEADLSADIPVERVGGNFDAVVARARLHAQAGEAVLLSPACSSFDMFRDYEERGRRFKALALQS